VNSQELFFTIIPIGFLIIGLLFMSKALNPVWQSRRSENWASTSGIVKAASIKNAIDGSLDYSYSHSYYSVHVIYRYMVDSIIYHSDTVHFGAEVRTIEDHARDELQEYTPGKSVVVHYDSRKPQRAVLKPGSYRLDCSDLAIGIGTFTVGSLTLVALLLIN